MYEESRSVPFAYALYAGAAIQIGLAFWIFEARWILYGAAALLAFLGWVAARYRVRFDSETLTFGFGHWHKLLRVGEIRGARAETVGLLTFGGAGWRLGRGKIGYVRWFGPAVAVVTETREYWFSCERPEVLLHALGRAGIDIRANV